MNSAKQYKYSGTNAFGKQVTGSITAQSVKFAKAELAKRGFRINSISSTKNAISFLSFGVSIKELSRFTRQFAAMYNSGLSLIESFSALNSQVSDGKLKDALNEIFSDIKSGLTLANALKKFPRIFNDLYCSMVEAGEASGELGKVLNRLSDYLEKSASTRRKVISALSYPLVIVVVAIVVVSVLLTFVVPTFATMFNDLGKELPLLTKTIIGISGFIKSNILIFLFFTIVLTVVLKKYFRSEGGSLFKDRMILKIPLFGDLFNKSITSRFTRTLSTLLASRLTLTKALPISAKSAGNRFIEQGVINSLSKIKKGSPIASTFKDEKIFNDLVIQMIAIGEKTGDLATMLDKIADFYDDEVDAAVDSLLSIMEPIIIVVLAAIIGVILIAMYLPMFDLITGLG